LRQSLHSRWSPSPSRPAAADEAKASNRSLKHLTNKINHYAHKNKLGSVKVGSRSTVCSKAAGLDVCKSSAKVCG